MEDSVKEYDIEQSPKYPKVYGEKDDEVYDKRVWDMFNKKVEDGVIPQHQVESFKSAIEEESRVFEKVDMKGFILSMSDFVCYCKETGIAVV